MFKRKDDDTPDVSTMTNSERAAQHAARAEDLLSDVGSWKTQAVQAQLIEAGAHATLALYYRDMPEQS